MKRLSQLILIYIGIFYQLGTTYGLKPTDQIVKTIGQTSTKTSTQTQTPSKNMDHITVSLLTVGSDQFLYSSWGHSTLRIQDKIKGTDLTYNWGIYDPDTPMFLWKFVKETLPYKLHILRSKFYINFILKSKNRRLVEDLIQLNDLQKIKLLEKIAWWSKPENHYYPYHSYKRNCATQIRDLLNEVLDHQLKDKYGTTMTQHSWRTYWQNYFLHWPITKFAGDLVFNQKIDQKLSLWEEMFIPDKLKEQLTNAKIIVPAKVWLDIPALQKPATSALVWFTLLFMIPLLMILLSIKNHHQRLFRVGLSLLCVEWAFFSGLFGFLIIFISLLTARDYFYFGANVWILNILDWWLMIPAWKLMKNEVVDTKVLEKIGMAHLFGIFAYLFLWMNHMIKQDITIPLQSIIPIGLLFSLILIYTHKKNLLYNDRGASLRKYC